MAAVVAAFSLPLRPALAADLPSIKGPPAYVPPPVVMPFSWTGFYIGVNGGYGLDHFSFPYADGLPGGATATGRSALTERGAVLGGQIGFNYELSNLPVIGHAVIGVEADSDWADIAGSSTANTALGPLSFGTRIRNFGTLRGRLGYNFGRLLLFASTGISYATTEDFYSIGGVAGSSTATDFPFRLSVWGAGAEYAFTNNLTIKAEYLYDYVKAGYQSYSLPSGASVGFSSRTTFHVLRVGLNYKFDWFSPSSPVVAKY